jgi:hypothetical protein
MRNQIEVNIYTTVIRKSTRRLRIFIKEFARMWFDKGEVIKDSQGIVGNIA